MKPTRLAWQNLPAQMLIVDDSLAEQWDVLNAARANLPFLSAYAMRAALRAFGRGKERLMVGYADEGIESMLLLDSPGSGRWQTFQPSQIPLGCWVARAGLDPVTLARSLLQRAFGTAPVMSLTQLDPLHAPRSAEGPSWAVTDYIKTGWIDVTGSFDGYWASRGKNLRSNLRKQHNRLAADGIACRLVEFRDPADMADGLARYGALESSGWKGREGTAIHPDNQQGRFYRELLEGAARRGEAVIHEYRFDERTVASNLCLQRDGVLVILKTTYDESIDKAFSPAFLLHHDQLRGAFDSGAVRRVEYYGRFMEWHSRWTDQTRILHHLTCYRWPWLKRIVRMKPAEALRSSLATTGLLARGKPLRKLLGRQNGDVGIVDGKTDRTEGVTR